MKKENKSSGASVAADDRDAERTDGEGHEQGGGQRRVQHGERGGRPEGRGAQRAPGQRAEEAVPDGGVHRAQRQVDEEHKDDVVHNLCGVCVCVRESPARYEKKKVGEEAEE